MGLRAVLLAALGVALGLTALAVLVFWLRDTRTDPAEVLPADRTLAVLHAAQDPDVRRWQTHLPELSSLPPIRTPVHVAIVADAAGKRGWVLLPADARSHLPTSTLGERTSINGTEILQSAAGLLAAKAEPTLNRAPDYGTLQRAVPGAAWTYLSPIVSGLGPWNSTQAVAIVHDAQGADHLLALHPASHHARLVSPFLPIPANVSQVSFGNAEDFWKQILDPLPQPVRLRAAVLMNKATEPITGKETSLRYDILPSFRGPLTLSLATEPDMFTLMAQALDADPQTWFPSLATQNRVEFLHQTLDASHAFALRAVRERSGTAAVVQQAAGNGQLWRLGNLTLVTLPDRAVLTTSAAVAHQVAQGTTPLPLRLPALPGATLLAGGLLQPQTRDFLLADQQPILAALLPPLNSSQPLLWSVGQTGSVRVISVAPQNPAVVTPQETR